MSDWNTEPSMREAQPHEAIKAAPFVYRFNFMACEHNYYCAVCRTKPAVLVCYSGMLQPCWDCQREGYALIKLNWFDRLLGRRP